jgi:polyphenol oxidase
MRSPRTAGERSTSVLPGAVLATVHQVHSAEARYVAEPWPQGRKRPRADAMATDRPGLLLGILTADCAPVLLGRPRSGSGRSGARRLARSALSGITDSAIAAMEGIGARRGRIAAAIGPCIALPSYEVDEAFHKRFVDDDSANDRFFTDFGQRRTLHFDLPAYVRHRLIAAGIDEVETIHLDTYSKPRPLLQLSARHPSRRARLRPANQPDRPCRRLGAAMAEISGLAAHFFAARLWH